MKPASGDLLEDAIDDLDDFLDSSCLTREECVQELLREAPPGCLYCALEGLGDEEE